MGITSKSIGKAVSGITESNNYLILGPSDNRMTFGAAAPTSGTWKRGDISFNTGAAAGTVTGAGWICTAAGTPGTWKGFGDIAV